jgi:hypothetical protein
MTDSEMKNPYREGEKYQVIRQGGYLKGWRRSGMSPLAPWSLDLRIGTILTCLGRKRAREDGATIVHWLSGAGQPLESVPAGTSYRQGH